MVAKEEYKSPAQVLISVPKRNLKKAVKRNRVKRLIREVYRKRKQKLYDHLIENHLSINFAIIYTSKEILSYHELDEKIIVVIDRLIKANEKTTG